MTITESPHITTVLFDFDGVIGNTEGGRYEAYCEIFEQYGYDLRGRCSISDLVGFSGDGLMQKFFPEIPPAQAKAIVSQRQRLYMANLSRFCHPFPGMQQTVADIRQLGYYIALTTANATAVAEKLLEATGVAAYFDAVCGREICEDPVTKVKDYSRVPEQIGKTVEECVVVEDSPVGVAGAKRSGFLCVAFEHFVDPVLTEQADMIVHDYNEFRQLFGLLPIPLSS